MRNLSAVLVDRLLCRRISIRSLMAFALFAAAVVVLPHQRSSAQTASNTTHLYFFTSQGCAPCEVVKPALVKLDAAGYPVTVVDIRSRPDWAEHFRVNRTPTVIMVRDERIVGRHSGVISHNELLQWFATSGFVPATKQKTTKTQVATNQPDTAAAVQSAAGSDRGDDGFESPTMHTGTSTPANRSEKVALASTVKIKVEDAEGTSYATGTVVHSHGHESLVVTCGHVFRESKGAGEISGEYGFGGGDISVAAGELIFYDADARDIALLVLKTDNANGGPIPSVDIASKRSSIDIGDDAFSIGCDHGKNPTIRHTRIKNRAAYDGAIKYDIYGRPVDGRSGGGLFNDDGELIGVCNAAVVDFDEGIYTALDSIHWQLEHTNLAHLFRGPQSDSLLAADFDSTPAVPKEPLAQRPKVEFPKAGSVPRPSGRSSLVSLRGAGINSVRSDQEVLIIIRSKDDSQTAQTITLSNPSHRLVDYLQNMPPEKSEVRQLDVADFRQAKATSDRFRHRVQQGAFR